MSTTPTKPELAELIGLGAATIYEAQGAVGAVDPEIRPIDTKMRLAGPAFTVDVPAGDNLALHAAIVAAPTGSVLVVDYKAHMAIAVTGDIMAKAAQVRGLAGFVIDGAVRDSQVIADMGFPVFARGLSIRGPTKAGPGTIGRPVECGGAQVSTGDIVVGDRDGVVVIAAARFADVLEATRQRGAKEEAMKAALDQGKTTVELLGLAQAIADNKLA